MGPEQQNQSTNPGTSSGSAVPTEMYTPTETPQDNPAIIDTRQAPPQSATSDTPVHWSATEYVSAQKDGLWFVIFGIVVMAFIAADIFWLKSYTFSVLVVVMAATVIVYSHRPARVIDYTLSGNQGLYVGEKLYHFNEFKAFGLIQDQGNHSIMLIPTKRFDFGVSVYFPQEFGEQIVDILGARLPMQQLKLDAIDQIVRKLRL